MQQPRFPAVWLEKLKAFVFKRQRAYQHVFNGIAGEEVLKDLARFCRANDSTGHQDSHVAARLDGRREVFLRIQQHLRLTQEQVWALYGKPEL